MRPSIPPLTAVRLVLAALVLADPRAAAALVLVELGALLAADGDDPGTEPST